MTPSPALLVALCVIVAAMSSGCSRQAPSGEAASAPQSIRSTDCTLEQQSALERALGNICRELARADGPCRKTLAELDALESFRRQCRRGLTVQCVERQCGQYLPKHFYKSDDGTIAMGLGGLYGGAGCGGRDQPMLGPAHTLAHEMAHAAGLRFENNAEQVAYACRGEASVGTR